MNNSQIYLSQVGWGCRIHRLHLCRRVRPSQWVSSIKPIKPYDSEALALEIWGMSSTPLLTLLLSPLWPGVVALDRVLSITQIEQTACKQINDVKLWLLYSNIWNHLTMQKRAQARLRMLSTKYVYKLYIYIYI